MVKKSFPKIKKTLKWFLTDESWKVTKKDILGISGWTFLLSWLDSWDVYANQCWAHTSSTSHSSWCSAISQWSVSWYNSGWHVSRTIQTGSSSNILAHPESNHWSGIRTSSHWSADGIPKTIYNWSHLSYAARWGYTSQPSITWYTHNSGSTHSSWMAHVSWWMSCP